MKILMVCLGNICRSPIAQGVMQKLVTEHGLDWNIDSAGTNGFHNGEQPHQHSIQICKQNGIDISTQTSRRITRDDLKNYDYILCMAQEVIDEMQTMFGNELTNKPIKLLMEFAYPGQKMDIQDPWYGPASGYGPVFDLIQQGCEAFIQQKSTQKP